MLLILGMSLLFLFIEENLRGVLYCTMLEKITDSIISFEHETQIDAEDNSVSLLSAGGRLHKFQKGLIFQQIQDHDLIKRILFMNPYLIIAIPNVLPIIYFNNEFSDFLNLYM